MQKPGQITFGETSMPAPGKLFPGFLQDYLAASAVLHARTSSVHLPGFLSAHLLVTTAPSSSSLAYKCLHSTESFLLCHSGNQNAQENILVFPFTPASMNPTGIQCTLGFLPEAFFFFFLPLLQNKISSSAFH